MRFWLKSEGKRDFSVVLAAAAEREKELAL